MTNVSGAPDVAVHGDVDDGYGRVRDEFARTADSVSAMRAVLDGRGGGGRS